MATAAELDGQVRAAALAYQGEFAWFTVVPGLLAGAAYAGPLAAACPGALSPPVAALLAVSAPCLLRP